MCDADGPSLEHDVPLLLGIVHEIKQEVPKARSLVATFKTVFEQYQEQPQLLDAHLEHLSQPLLAVLIASANSLTDKHHFAAVMQVCRILQIMVHTCGHKTIALFLPNKPSDLTNAVALLTHVQALEATQEIDEDAQDGHWQTMYIVLLWLSVLVLVPFDLGAIEMPPGMQVQTGHTTESTFTGWLIAAVKPHMALPGPIRYCFPGVESLLVSLQMVIGDVKVLSMQGHHRGVAKQTGDTRGDVSASRKAARMVLDSPVS